MENKKFKLSEKVIKSSNIHDKTIIRVDDIKEFIRLLKEEMKVDDEYAFDIDGEILAEKIDKLSGDFWDKTPLPFDDKKQIIMICPKCKDKYGVNRYQATKYKPKCAGCNKKLKYEYEI